MRRTPVDGARHGGGQLAWLGDTGNWGRTDCAGLHQGFQMDKTQVGRLCLCDS